MRNFKIVLPGQAPIKKNSMGELWHRTDKRTGNKIPLNVPIKYYSKPYKEWAKRAVITLGNWKRNNPEGLEFPLSGTYIITFIFFRRTKQRIDLSNLYEGCQDVLTGTAGNFLDKTKMVGGIKKKIKFNHDLYKIIEDDNIKIIKNHGASTIYLVPFDSMCRTEIFFTEFTQEKVNYIFNYLYPDLKVGDEQELKLKL